MRIRHIPKLYCKELEIKEVKKLVSSNGKSAKVNVYFGDLADYKGMNEVFRGRFGPKTHQ